MTNHIVGISSKRHIGTFFRVLTQPCSNVSTTPIMAMGCRQCLPLSVVQLKGKHCRKPHCRNGVVDMFGLCQLLPVYLQMIKRVHLDLMIYDNGFLISHYLFELEFFERVLLVLYKKLETARGAAEKASFIRPALCLHFGPL